MRLPVCDSDERLLRAEGPIRIRCARVESRISFRHAPGRNRMSSHYDIIIVGSGAGGGTMALALAPTGKRILLLERGNYLRREQDNWTPTPCSCGESIRQ